MERIYALLKAIRGSFTDPLKCATPQTSRQTNSKRLFLYGRAELRLTVTNGADLRMRPAQEEQEQDERENNENDQ